MQQLGLAYSCRLGVSMPLLVSLRTPQTPIFLSFVVHRLYFAIVRQETRKPPLPTASASTQRQAVPQLEPSEQQAVSPFAAMAGSGGPSPPASGTVSPPLPLAGAGRRPSIESQRSISSVAGGIPTFKRAMPSAFTDVRLGPLIGRGAYGRVRMLSIAFANASFFAFLLQGRNGSPHSPMPLLVRRCIAAAGTAPLWL